MAMPSLSSSSSSSTTNAVPSSLSSSSSSILHNPSTATTLFFLTTYVLSGVCQPLWMTVCAELGLADPTAQLYMVFYYLGPSMLILTTLKNRSSSSSSTSSSRQQWPPWSVRFQAAGIACFDLTSQAANYTGAAWAGPALFAIIYSSVTVWTAVWARIILGRNLQRRQWLAVAIVFAGLALAAAEARADGGPHVRRGTGLVLGGAAMHAGSYVLSEVVMTASAHRHHPLSAGQNASLQGLVALALLLFWQCAYTLPRWDALIGRPTAAAGTTATSALLLFVALASTNAIHSFSFYHTIKHMPGGSVAAGVYKGLQAVIVTVVTHVLFCGRADFGAEMCFTITKGVSLTTVVAGVALFTYATHYAQQQQKQQQQLQAQQQHSKQEEAMIKQERLPLMMQQPHHHGADGYEAATTRHRFATTASSGPTSKRALDLRWRTGGGDGA